MSFDKLNTWTGNKIDAPAPAKPVAKAKAKTAPKDAKCDAGPDCDKGEECLDEQCEAGGEAEKAPAAKPKAKRKRGIFSRGKK